MVDEQEPESPLEPCQFVTMGEIGNAIFATVPRSHEHSSSEVPADPVWSPEAMIAFMYTRCQRRFGQAANESKRRLYAERLQLLRDVMAACRSNDPCTKLTAVQAIRAMEDLSEDEDSPHSEQNMSTLGFATPWMKSSKLWQLDSSWYQLLPARISQQEVRAVSMLIVWPMLYFEALKTEMKQWMKIWKKNLQIR